MSQWGRYLRCLVAAAISHHLLHNAYPETGDCPHIKSNDVGSPIFHLPVDNSLSKNSTETLETTMWCQQNYTLPARSDTIDQAVVCAQVICESRRRSPDCFICPSIAKVNAMIAPVFGTCLPRQAKFGIVF